MTKAFLIIFSIFLSLQLQAQFPKFELKNTIEQKEGNYIVYMTAVWCKPCMDELPDIIDSFKKVSNYKLIVWFERSYLDTSSIIQKKFQKKFGDSLFYFFPLRYYSFYEKNRILINPQNKILRQIMDEINGYVLPKVKWKDWTWGKLILINTNKVFVAKSIKKIEQIKEIMAKLKEFESL